LTETPANHLWLNSRQSSATANANYEAAMGTISRRTKKGGGTVYHAEVRHRGSPALYKAFTRLTDARFWIQDIESKLRSGSAVVEAETRRHTLAEAIDRFILEELPKKPRYYADQKREVLWFKHEAGNKVLAEVNPALLNELKSKFLLGITRFKCPRLPQTWNRYLSSISCVFEMCVREWLWLEVNPARRVKREREAPGRVRFLSNEEREKLLEACRQSQSPNLYPLVVLALSTGMRRGEIRRLTWEQVDLAAGVIILTLTKNKDRRRVTIRGLALSLLREHGRVRRIDTNLVFPGENSGKTGQPFSLDNFWYRALKQAEISNFRFHDLRHSTGSYLAMNGASLLEIAEVLGHRTLAMVKRYSHLAESHTAMVVENMNRKIFGV
jgi:integrase